MTLVPAQVKDLQVGDRFQNPYSGQIVDVLEFDETVPGYRHIRFTPEGDYVYLPRVRFVAVDR